MLTSTSTTLDRALENLRKANIQNMISQIKSGRYELIIKTLTKHQFRYTDEERMFFVTEVTNLMSEANCKELGAILELVTVKCMM